MLSFERYLHFLDVTGDFPYRFSIKDSNDIKEAYSFIESLRCAADFLEDELFKIEKENVSNGNLRVTRFIHKEYGYRISYNEFYKLPDEEKEKFNILK